MNNRLGYRQTTQPLEDPQSADELIIGDQISWSHAEPTFQSTWTQFHEVWQIQTGSLQNSGGKKVKEENVLCHDAPRLVAVALLSAILPWRRFLCALGSRGSFVRATGPILSELLGNMLE